MQGKLLTMERLFTRARGRLSLAALRRPSDDPSAAGCGSGLVPPNAEERRLASGDVFRRDPSTEHRVEVRVSGSLLRFFQDRSRHPF